MHLSRQAFVLAAAIAIVLVAVAVRPATAGIPTDVLKNNIDRVIKVLEDSNLKSLPQERRAALRKLASEIFDVGEAARRSLGRHWHARTPPEREEFIQLFSDLLEASYISTVEQYSGEKIVYGGDTIDGDQATVRTKLITKQGTDTPVDYRMLKKEDKWMVYDVSIEGVSLIANYRTQFTKIIQASSYQELVKKLRNKPGVFTAPDKPAS
jgi:phospholipid transport system substrate-binding protein